MSHHVEVVADHGDLCGEGPLWDPRTGRLLWVDNERSLVLELDPATGRSEAVSRDLHVGGIALNQDGSYVCGGAGGLHVWCPHAGHRTLATHDGDVPLQFNDIVAGPHGVYGGTMYWGAAGMERLGRLYLFRPDGSFAAVEEGVECSNGLGFSPDDRTLYYVDTTRRVIHAYDVDPGDGTLSGRRTFVRVTADEGIPDGLTVDRDGFVWCAHWYGGEIVRYDPDGSVERRIRMPARQVSSVMFGGPNLTDLYVTSAANSWRSGYAPPGYDFDAPGVGGALYRVRTGIQGRPEHVARFA